MSIKFNPLIFGGFDLTGGAAGAVEWKLPVADESSLPMAGNTPGDARVVLDTDKIYVWDDTTSKWIDTELTAAAVGVSPNPEGLTLSTLDVTVGSADITRRTINLEPADATNPGVVSTDAQTFAGDKAFTDLVDAQGGVDSSTGTLDIGATATTINIGAPGATVTIQGDTIYEHVTNLYVKDKTITINDGGAAGSAGNAGVEIEEDGSIAGYVQVSSDRNSWELRAPNQTGVATIDAGISGITINQSSHDPLTLGVVGSSPNINAATLSGQVLNLEPADAVNAGLITATAQTFGGDKTFNDDVIVIGNIDAQGGINSSGASLDIGATSTQINVYVQSDFQSTPVSNISSLTLTPTTTDGVVASLYTNNGPDFAAVGFSSNNPGSAELLYSDGGVLSINSSASVTIDSLDVNIGQVSGTTDIVGTVTIEYNPADPTDWAPAPDDVIEAIDQLAERFVEQDQVTKEPTGFPNRTDSVISFNDGTHTFSISPAIVGGSYDFYVKGKKFTKSVTTESIAIPTPSSGGNYYFYFDSTGTLTISPVNTFNPTTILQESAFIASVYWNSDTNTHTYFAEERHGLTMDGVTHAYLHTVFGARYLSGLALNFSSIPTIVDGTGNLPQNAQFPSDSGSLRDEDILHTLSSQSTIPILYRQGQLWRKKTADSYPLVYSGTVPTYAGTRVPYNQFTGGSWTLTEVQDGKYVLVHYFGTNDADPGNAFVGIQGINEYGSIEAARTGANTEITSLAGLPFAEFVPVGSVIFQTRTTYTNAPKARIVSTDTGANYVDFRGTQLYTPAGTATTHGLLSGLSNDDHFQYLLADGTRAMSGALDMGTHQINNVVDGVANDDAATVGQLTNATTGTPNFFAGYDNTGVLSEVPGWVVFDDGSLEIGAQNSITIPPTVDDYISISISPTVAPTSTDLVNLSGVQLNSPIDNNITSYNGFQVFGYGTAAPDNFTGYQSTPGYSGTATNITHFSASGSADCSGNFVGLGVNSSGDANNITGVNVSTTGNSTTLTGVQVSPSGTHTDATGLKIDLTSATITNRPVAADISGGSFSTTETFQANPALLVDSGNVFRPVFEVESGSPLANTTDVIMNNLAGFMDFKDYYISSPLGIGVTSVGFVSQVAATPVGVVDKISMMTAGLAVDSTSSGGTIIDAHLMRGFATTFGGSLTIDNLYGLQIADGLSSIATNAYGISVEDASADNFLAKSLIIGGTNKQTTNNEIALEIGSTKAVKLGLFTTAERNALTTLNGLVVFDTEAVNFFGYNGTNWVPMGLPWGDISTTLFEGVDNQATPANIDGFVFAFRGGFEAIVRIERGLTYAEYTLKGIKKQFDWEMSQDYIGDDTGVAFNITSSGQIQYTSTSTGDIPFITFRADTV